MNKGFFDRDSPDFAARRAEARKLLDELDPAMQGAALPADPSRLAWFEAVYALAKGDPARVPWANLAPHPLTQAFVAAHAAGLKGLRVLDVGCGLGDNAECFAAAGAQVTAFDLVGAAVDWARQRFPASRVTYTQADLFALPDGWRQAFDLVHECYTLQALSPALLPQALAALKSHTGAGRKTSHHRPSEGRGLRNQRPALAAAAVDLRGSQAPRPRGFVRRGHSGGPGRGVAALARPAPPRRGFLGQRDGGRSAFSTRPQKLTHSSHCHAWSWIPSNSKACCVCAYWRTHAD